MSCGRFDFLESVSTGPSRLSRQEPVILYGAGNIGKDLAAALTRRGIPIVCFLDRNAAVGAAASGIPVRRPDDPEVDRSKHAVIISIFNRDVAIPDVVDDLRRQGYTSVLTLLDIYEEVLDEMGERFWLGRRSLYRESRAAIEAVAALWADEQSRDLYRQVVQFRVTGDYALLPLVEGGQYFPATIPAWEDPVRLVDAGAYDGDTLRAFLAAGHQVSALAAFEPDKANFSILSDCVREHRGRLGKEVSLFPCALWSETAQLRFTAGQGEASRIAAEANAVVQGVRLDDAVPGFAPTLIKLDVEGAEELALEGAADTIRRYRPGLAVCVYHRPADLWRLPLQVRALSERYRLYLRCHGCSTFDLVLYGVPCARGAARSGTSTADPKHGVAARRSEA
jgi:FkbM family methyltransferase